MFIGTVTSCKKDGTTKDYVIPDEKDTTVIVPPKEDTTVIVPPKKDTVYVIDTTKKTTINEIVYFTEDKFMVVGSGTEIWQDVAYGNGRWVAVSSNGKIATSTDGVNWTTKQVGTTYLYGVAYGDDIWVAVGSVVITSTDGINWTTKSLVAHDDFTSVVYFRNPLSSNGRWMAVGYSGYITTSIDRGETWTTKQVGTTNWYGVAFYHESVSPHPFHVMKVSTNVISGSASMDSSTWYPKTVTGNWSDIACGDGRWVAVGDSGKIATSTSMLGDTWSVQIIDSSIWFYGIAYGNGRWIAVGYGYGGSSGYNIATSTNGINWTTKQVGTTNTWFGVAFKN
jgi:hypothetical protein